MANVHVLENSRLVIHIAVPNTNNQAGVNWRTALTRSGLGGKTVLADGDGTQGTISAAEKTSVLSGAIYEFTCTPKYAARWTLAELDAFVTKATSEELVRMQQALNTFGVTR